MLLTLPELITNARASLRCLDAETAMGEIQATAGTIIDVREPIEVESLAAPNSINIPRGILEMKILDVVTEEDHPIYLHCATGGWATRISRSLPVP